MLSEVMELLRFIQESFLQIWPYLLVTIPIAVAVQVSGASKFINQALGARPVIAIVLAALVGAFSPFCSCTVIPVVAALLIGGVPLAPVMSFWIASPSMDPEIFFLSVGILGWELAVWRLAAALILSLAAGFVTHWIERGGWLGEAILRDQNATKTKSVGELLRSGVRSLLGTGTPLPVLHFSALSSLPEVEPAVPESARCTGSGEGACAIRPPSFRERLLRESWSATKMVVQFMLVAFTLEALISMYVPEVWVTRALGGESLWTIFTAGLLGVPIYTSNLTALPLVGGLLSQGMNPGAALAFLIAGPTTTFPAMAAVWKLASRRVFALYVSYSFIGALAVGYLYNLVR